MRQAHENLWIFILIENLPSQRVKMCGTRGQVEEKRLCFINVPEIGT